jgi:hypothetical protein
VFTSTTFLTARNTRHVCLDFCPPGYQGHWRNWHRGHGCNRDDSVQQAPCADELEAAP